MSVASVSYELDREREMNSVGLSVVNSVKRGYPPEEGAHIAIS